MRENEKIDEEQDHVKGRTIFSSGKENTETRVASYPSTINEPNVPEDPFHRIIHQSLYDRQLCALVPLLAGWHHRKLEFRQASSSVRDINLCHVSSVSLCMSALPRMFYHLFLPKLPQNQPQTMPKCSLHFFLSFHFCV